MFAIVPFVQLDKTPLDLAVEKNNIDTIYYFLQKCNQDISTLQQVAL